MSASLKARIADVFDEPGCDKNQAKSEKERKKGCTRQLMPGAAAGGCAFDGAKIALQPIVDVAHLVHGPIACEGNSWDNRHSASSGPTTYRTGFTKVTKKELGLPRWEDATERQRRDHMCYKDEAELYNDGQAFKCCARDERGVIVTVIADNYFGYCKKEVKTQISYSANLFGLAEEEHAETAERKDCVENRKIFRHLTSPPQTCWKIRGMPGS